MNVDMNDWRSIARGLLSARARADDAEAAIHRVRALHVEVARVCVGCSDFYPCPTIRALDGEA